MMPRWGLSWLLLTPDRKINCLSVYCFYLPSRTFQLFHFSLFTDFWGACKASCHVFNEFNRNFSTVTNSFFIVSLTLWRQTIRWKRKKTWNNKSQQMQLKDWLEVFLYFSFQFLNDRCRMEVFKKLCANWQMFWRQTCIKPLRQKQIVNGNFNKTSLSSPECCASHSQQLLQ